MNLPQIVIGTRGSRLALVQADLVVRALQAKRPQCQVTVKTIVTKGDKNHSPIPLDTVGKAWFTKEIEDALLRHEIDLAVHSLKDFPPETTTGLYLIPILARDDPRDVLVAKDGSSLNDLPRGAVVGTDSLRRKSQLLYHRSDLNVKSIRGNVDSRLQKLETDGYDAVVLAAAGLLRLGLADRVTQYFAPGEFVPAAGQAVLAAEIRDDDAVLRSLLQELQDPDTALACRAERAFTDLIGGGCKLPVGCFALLAGSQATIFGTVGSMDAKKAEIKSIAGPRADAVTLASALANELLHESARAGW